MCCIYATFKAWEAIMKTIGQTVKMIRQIKGFTQSEVYSGVMSRSFAHRFENGENDISAAKLFKILDNLSISANDLLRAYNGHDLQTMGQIIAETQKSSRLSYKSVAAMGQILVVTYYSKTFTVTPAMENLWDTLFASQTWTLEEIRQAQILLPIAVSRHQEALISEIVDRVKNDVVRRAIAWQPQPAHGLQDTEGEEVEEALKDVAAGGVKFFNFLTFEDGDVLAPHAALEVRVAKLIAAGAVGEAKGEVAFAMNLIMYLTAV